MIKEGIHDRLKEVYDEFDRHCRVRNIDYSIDADYQNVQGYRLLDCPDVPDFLRHISNFVKDRSVNLQYDGFSVDYDDLKNNDFNVSTYNPLFMFTLETIAEDDMINERQRKTPTMAHTDKQAQFSPSFRPNKPGFQYESGGKKKKKKEEPKEETSESFGRKEPFGERLMSAINETIVQQIDPDILFTHNPVEHEEDVEESLKDAVQSESLVLNKYLAILERVDGEEQTIILENIISKCTNNINALNGLLSNYGS